MYKSPSQLSEDVRVKVEETLNARLADGLDLHSQIKVAHWNIKGPQFAALHPLFETFATGLALHNDAIAERAVTLGARPTVPRGTWPRPRPCRSTRRRPRVTWTTCGCSRNASRSTSRAPGRRARSARSSATPTRSTF